MSVVHKVLDRLPAPLRTVMLKHRELLKFAVVGGTAWVIDTIVFYTVKLWILDKPLTAKVIAVLVATAASYVLNREWSFRTRGGRRPGHEASLFFVISGLAFVLYLAPLAVSRYVLDLKQPAVSFVTEQVADFVSSQVIGVLLGMIFRYWAFRRFVFPQSGVRNLETSYDTAGSETDTLDGPPPARAVPAASAPPASAPEHGRRAHPESEEQPAEEARDRNRIRRR
ncbi:GtrA family protein [Actinoalloteichus caeruleus]|nr:GtrA family protein [Actinoalloteichus caeruleus]